MKIKDGNSINTKIINRKQPAAVTWFCVSTGSMNAMNS